MKFKLLCFSIFLSIGALSAQLVSYEFIQTYSIAEMQQVISGFGAAGVINPTYEVDLYRVWYRTEYNDSTTLVTGALAIPKNPDCKPPLISYQHGTTFTKLGVPSYGSSELQICLVFASEGNVLVAPDYIGLGGSNIPLHPYQHAFSQAHSTINLLRATRELQTALDFELSNQLFLFGYSQGGHATAAALKYIEQNYASEFQVTAAMPMSGAYDLSGAQTDFINNGQPYATPAYLPYIVMGYQTVYHDLYDSIQEIFVPPYDSTMPYYFLDGTYGSFINSQCDPYPINMFTQQAQDGFFNDPNFPFSVRLQENDLLDWTPQSKIRMYYCTGDEQVYYRNSVVADSIWNYNGAPDAAAVFLTNENHGGCVDNAIIAARLFFGNLVNRGIDILISYNAATNSFTVDILNDNINDYDILWGDGSTSATISNVVPNVNYEVSLTDKTTGCNNSRRFSKETVSGIATINELLSVNVYPNPSSDFIIVDLNLTENNRVNIIDNQGKLVYNFEFQKGTEPMINISALSNGTYYILLDGYKDYAASFVKK
jgi:pimeloyl-ACP methyl ester carboxylesterase